MKHSKYDEVYTLVKNNINVLLTSEAGSGKTTLLHTIAKDLELDFYAISMTRQTTLNSLLGFISINGNYIESPLRKAVENGGMLLFDEIDAADPNVILCMNTLENGFMSFPDKIVDVHPDFRWVATANPQDQHQIYTGRSKLDAATLSRFDVVELELDKDLEVSLTSSDTVEEIHIMRELLAEMNSSKTISMRDTIRLHQRKQLGLADNYHKVLLGSDDLVGIYNSRQAEIEASKPKELSECTNIDELWDNLPTETTTDFTDYTAGSHTTTSVDESMEKSALHIARHYILTGGIQSEYSEKGWAVGEAPLTEDPYKQTIIVHHGPTNKSYTFNKKEIEL